MGGWGPEVCGLVSAAEGSGWLPVEEGAEGAGTLTQRSSRQRACRVPRAHSERRPARCIPLLGPGSKQAGGAAGLAWAQMVTIAFSRSLVAAANPVELPARAAACSADSAWPAATLVALRGGQEGGGWVV